MAMSCKFALHEVIKNVSYLHVYSFLFCNLHENIENFHSFGEGTQGSN